MKRLDVYYCGWSEDWLLGHLADDGHALLFEYSSQALAEGLELSPIHLKLRAQAYDRFATHQHRLPGLMADSLPDGWGLMLMDRLFRQRGLPQPGPLDRLAFIGDRALGALRYVPSCDVVDSLPDWDLQALAAQTAMVVAGDAKIALPELAVLGGSPQGARPKALVQHHLASGTFSTLADAPGDPWLVKFPAQGEHKEVCALEQMYAELARDCGLEMPPSAYFDLGPHQAAFGVARFDRVQGHRVACHSLAGLLGVDFRVAGTVDYTGFLRATRLLTRDEKEVGKAFARAVFNVVFHNRDDHPKNFAWCLHHDRRWRLAPAFDLTFSDGPMGQHHMDVCGHATDIERDHLLELAHQGGVDQTVAQAVIDQMLEQAAGLMRRASEFEIRKTTTEKIGKVVAAAIKRLSR